MSKANRPCCVDGCERPVTRKGAKGMCPRHYQRMLRGVPVDGPRCESCPNPVHRPQRFCSDECKPRCTVEGCDGHQRKRTWCASHYAQWKYTGQEPVPFLYKWGQPTPPGSPRTRKEPRPRKLKPQLCVVCGSTERTIKTNRFCSSGCKTVYYRYDGNPPRQVKCAQCGTTIDLIGHHPNGRRKRSTARLCDDCVPWTWRCAGITVHDLADRDGTDCGICGEPVDMALTRNDGRMCPSIDHIVPRSRGGSDDPANLQLAHLSCNCQKSDRMD